LRPSIGNNAVFLTISSQKQMNQYGREEKPAFTNMYLHVLLVIITVTLVESMYTG
jgi:hypothetical protein